MEDEEEEGSEEEEEEEATIRNFTYANPRNSVMHTVVEHLRKPLPD